MFKAIYERRSIRSFKKGKVGDELIVKVLDAARWAPSGGNIQPWRFIVVKDEKMVRLIKMFSPGLFGEPPVVIVVCSDKREAYRKGGEIGRDYLSIVDCAMATQNILLAAYALGLGTCVVKSFNSQAVKKILKLPDHVEPELLVTLGYPLETPKPPPRKPLNEIVYLNYYGERWSLNE